MDTLIHIWNTFVHSNTFNFVVMLLVLYYIVKKLNLNTSLNNSAQDVSVLIEKSTKERLIAEEELNKTKETVKNTDTEAETTMEKAKDYIIAMQKKAMADTELKVSQIKEGIAKNINSEAKKISSAILTEVAKTSLNKAKEGIIAELNANPTLHERYIDESLEQIDRIQI